MSKRSSATATPAVPKKTRIDLEDVSTISIPGTYLISTISIPGTYLISGSVIVEALWRNCVYSGCSLCNRKVDETECSFCPPDVPTKLFYRLRVLFKQAGVQLWVTTFSEVAQALVGKPVEKFNSLDQTDQKTAVDDAIGSEWLVCIFKQVKGRFTNYVIDHICHASV